MLKFLFSFIITGAVELDWACTCCFLWKYFAGDLIFGDDASGSKMCNIAE